MTETAPKMKGGIIKRGTTWACVIRVMDPATGKTKAKWLSGFATQKEAKAAQAEHRTDVAKGMYIAPSKLTVGVWLDQWLAGQHQLRPSTAHRYAQKVRCYLKPTLGHEKLQALTPSRLSILWGDLASSGGRGGNPLSVTTVRDCRMILQTACEAAIEENLLPRNPVSRSKLPKDQRELVKMVWSPDEQAAFLSARRDSRWYPLWRLALGTGARRGELLALRWQDINLTGCTVRFGRSAVQVGKDVITNPTTKNGSVRTVSIDEATAAALRELKKRQAEERLAMGGSWGNDEDLVFTWEDGTRARPDFATKKFVEEQVGTSVPRMNLHGTRHSHATALLRAGVTVTTVSQRLGHRNVTVTLNTYSHVLTGDDADVANLFGKLLNVAEA